MEIKKPNYLLSIAQDAKTIKGQKAGYLTGIMYLAPEKESGVMNACPFASPGCSSGCLYNTGRAAMNKRDGSNPIKTARITRTKYFKFKRNDFFTQLKDEIDKLIKKADKKSLIPVIRLNGMSDLPFENMDVFENPDKNSDKELINIFELYPEIQFYDYTKNYNRAMDWAAGLMPDNYHLTFSRSEENQDVCDELAKLGVNIAVVFSSQNLPDTYMGYRVVNGDETDLRFLDADNVIVGLKAKGNKAKKDNTGFVIHV